MKRTCLVTGADGLLGSHLLHQLKDDDVYVVSKRQSSSFPKHCRRIYADLTEEDSYREFPENIDAIIHLAQSNNFRLFPDKALDIAGVNTFSTLRLLDYAKRAGAKHFIYASTGSVYPSGNTVCDEAASLSVQRHGGMYYASKMAGELFVDAYSQMMTTVILRFFFIYGPMQRKTMLIPRLVDSVAEGRPIMLQGENGIQINPIYVLDAARAVDSALNLSSSATINVAGAEVLSLKEMGDVIGEVVGRNPIFEQDYSKAPQDVIGDIKKMKQMLIDPQIGFREGVSLYSKKLFGQPSTC